ncbi:MAG: 50S ribosomal protein L32 [Planctomycetes bacterium]|jgi:large subunit ribosomal protein L32|nr:50S ribosomal protein L32 [Planctomycetota bacterium]
MAVPKRRTSRSKKGTRRSHHAVTPVQIQFCARCSEPVMPHRVCSHCGYYQGRDAILVDDKQGK